MALATSRGEGIAQDETGPHRFHYAIESLEDGSVARRGEFLDQRDPATGRLRGGGLPHESVILAPQTRYRYWLLEVATALVGFRDFETPTSGERWTVGRVRLSLPPLFDSDGDGLHDTAEFIVGTDASLGDTDDDGIEDGAEVAQGLDPLDGRPARTGIVASADTPGTAVDVCAVNDVAAVADSDRGVSVFNIFNGMDPVIIAQVDTPGNAHRIACSGAWLAIADGAFGLAVVDIAEPATARVVHQVPFNSDVVAVTTSAGLAFVGLLANALAEVDLASGAVLERLALPAPPADLAFGDDHLYVLTGERLHAVTFGEEVLRITGSAESPIVASPNERLFVGGGFAYAVHGKGYNTFRLDNPDQPVLVRATDTAQFGWKQIALNGSGLGLAAVGPNRSLDGPHNVSIYDTSDPALTEEFRTEFVTPGIARAISLYNGLGYVADQLNGLQVINYLAYDDLGVPPQVALTTSFSDQSAEEGKLERVTAEVSDDVQVRNVEFYLDGRKAFTDGNFPFEYRFVTPRIAEQPSFTLRARASDTGGNASWTPELLVALEPDLTPPRILRLSPADGAFVTAVGSVTVFFDESIDPGTLTSDSFRLSGESGPVVPAGLEYRDAVAGAFMNLAADLPPGVYEGEITTTIADPNGNHLSAPGTWTFTVYETVPGDGDGDCVPDAIELELGLDPASVDSDGDGIPDGSTDSDGDGLVNCDEVLRGLEAGRADTDGDGLADGEELALATDPLLSDSDADGFLDGEEVDDGSNPLLASSTPVPADASVREAVASSVAVLNETDPTGAQTREAVGARVSVLNETDPIGAQTREAVGASVSVLNAPP